jgi:hypothetical protein
MVEKGPYLQARLDAALSTSAKLLAKSKKKQQSIGRGWRHDGDQREQGLVCRRVVLERGGV